MKAVAIILGLVLTGCVTLGGWSDRDKGRIEGECRAAISGMGVPPDMSAKYCDCVIPTIEKNVPSPTPEAITTFSKTELAQKTFKECAEKVFGSGRK